MKDISKGLVYAGIFVIPAIVLIIANSMFFPFITGKNFTFRVIVEIVFAAWIVLALYEPQYRPRFSWILATFASLLGVMFFADFLGVNRTASFWSNFERMEGYVTLVHTFLYMLVAGTVLTSAKLWDRFFMTTIGVAVVLSLYAFAQLSGNITINQGGMRLDGTLGNSAYMAIYMLFHIFITFFMLFRTKSTAGRMMYGALVLLFIYLLIQTATRGTILGLVGGSFVMAAYIALFAKEYPGFRKSAVGGIATIVIIVSLFITFKESSFIQNNPYLQRIATISLAEGSNRFNIWSMAFEGVKERPLLGWGQSNYNFVFNKYYRPELHGQEAWFDRVHNIVMDWLIAGGFIGLIAYFSIFGSAVFYLFVRPLFRKHDETFTVVERGVLLGLLTGYLVHNMVVFDNIVSYIFYASILAFIHSRVSVPCQKMERYRFDTVVVEQVVTPIVAVVLVAVVYYVNVPGIQAAGDIIDAFRATDQNAMVSAFDTALKRNSFGNQEIREQFTQRVQSFLQDPNVAQKLPEAEKKKLTDRIEEELLKQIEERPNDARTEMFISSFYRSTGQIDKAIAHLETARTLSPRKQLIIFEQGYSYLQKQEYDRALEFFKEAYDLGPQFEESRILYAMAAMYAGKTDLVSELINTDQYSKAFARNDGALQAAYRAHEYDLLISMLELRIAENPMDTQNRTSLAFVQNEKGDIAAAVKTLQKAGEDIPEFKAQSEEFIRGMVTPETIQNIPIEVSTE